MTNPLIELATRLNYQTIEPSKIKKAIDYWLTKNRAQISEIEKLGQTDINWQNSAQKLLNQFNNLSKAFSVASHLNNVNDSQKMREVFEYCLTEVQKFSDELEQNKLIYQSFLELKKNKNLSNAQIRYLDLEIEKFERNGVHLAKNKSDSLKKINQKLAGLSLKFEQNIQDSANQFSLIIEDKKQLKGLSQNLINNFKNQAENKKGYLIELDQPTAISILQSAENRELRAKIHQAWTTRASSEPFNNENLIHQIYKLRNDKAELLGFEDYCDFTLSERMAKNYQTVEKLLIQIGKKAQDKAKKEMAELKKIAKTDLKITELKAYDIAFICQKLKEKTFGFNDETLRAYFPVHKVMTGLFEIIQDLYQVQFLEVEYSSWDEKVKTYEIWQDNQLIGILYADLYARKNKRSGAWMSDYQSFLTKQYHNQSQIPVAFINMNFLDTKGESYLTFEDVLTLFHETGHSLHHLLTKVGLLSISGINSVQWDAVELPSQLMENFCYNWHYLQKMSAHQKTGESLPIELFNQIIAAKNQFSGLFLIRQLIFALFDLKTHHQNNYKNWQTILSELKNNWSVSPLSSYDKPAHSFSHIFAGGYASGYYSYLWADILSSDIYGSFIENSELEVIDDAKAKSIHPSYFAKTANAKNGKKFLNCLLSQGALKDAKELFIDFRNREPDFKYLFESYGIN